ncbi:jg26465 [Pararge aegeria aegeria]|uniref:Jg26465 protein n=1 Tax=Pararge aegeria aegeria TaxID=348720 RepID=A0A8S4QGD7_9NEOP|nr:jg26465 [Pararge aegeria aegeria]
MRRGGGRTRCAQPRSKHESSSSSSSSSLDEFKTPPTSAGDVTPPPVRRTCRGGTTRRHQYKKDDDHSTSASLEQQGLRAPANAPVTGGVCEERITKASTRVERECALVVRYAAAPRELAAAAGCVVRLQSARSPARQPVCSALLTVTISWLPTPPSLPHLRSGIAVTKHPETIEGYE